MLDGCRADSVPNLEIETGEIVGAEHASTTGRFDDEQLFYLRSRGISESEARRLVVHSFFADIIRKIGVPELEASLPNPRSRVGGQHQRGIGVMSDFVRACRVAGVAPDSGHSVEIAGTELAIVHSDGQFYAIADECSHAAIPLSEGDVGDGEIECYLHGSRFDLRTGEPIGLPATEPVAIYRCRVGVTRGPRRCLIARRRQERPAHPTARSDGILDTSNTQES